jgi:hypothetical protein
MNFVETKILFFFQNLQFFFKVHLLRARKYEIWFFCHFSLLSIICMAGKNYDKTGSGAAKRARSF